MDDCTSTVQSKMSRIETSLLELNNEILTGVRFLLSVKEEAAEIVKNLNCITTPATYLQEFVNVNSFILKYLNFLTEINCKFEVLNISENKRAFSGNKIIHSAEMSEVLQKLSSPCKCKEKPEDKTINEMVIIEEQLSESDTNFRPVEYVETKTATEKMEEKNYQRKSVKILACRNTNKTSSESLTIIKTALNSNNNGKNTNDIENKNDCTVQLTYTEKNNLILESECNDISDNQVSDDQDHSNPLQLSEAATENESTCLNENPLTGENEEEKSFVDVSCSPSNDVTKNNPGDEVTGSGIHSFEDIPVAEIVPMKIQARNSEVLDDANGTERAEDPKTTQNSKVESDIDKEDCIRPEEIIRTVGKAYDVTIEHIKSPSEFYVSIIGKQSNFLPELEKQLKLFPLSKPKVSGKTFETRKALLSKEIGTYALFYSKCDEMWCRVEIINWCLNLNDNFVTAFLLDYGETKCVSIDDLTGMPDCFKKYPASVHRCHLHGIIPIDMDEKDDTLYWDKTSSEKMKSLTENSKTLRIKIVPGDRFHPYTSLPVTLWLTDVNHCVNQLLVISKYAMWSSDQAMVISEETEENANEKLKDWDPMKEDFESYLNSYDLDMNDPAASIYGYVGNDYRSICKHFAQTGFCFKGISCKKEHKRLDPLGFTRDEEEVYKNAFNVLPSPPPKSVLHVQVTCLLKFNQFFCIPESNKLTSSEEDLQSLFNCMNKAENIRDMKKLLIPPSAGQIVIARYSEDGCWYRARILDSQPEKDMYTVVFMDYGNKETMPLSVIRDIEPRYLHLPFQAMQCFIFGVDENPKVALTHAMGYMSSKINDGLITIEVVACLPGDYINLLVNVFDQNGRDIGRDLIEMEYAANKEEMIISSESESVPG